MNSQLRHTEPFHSTSNLTRVGISRRSTGRVSTVGSWHSIRSQTTALDSLDWRLRVETGAERLLSGIHIEWLVMAGTVSSWSISTAVF
ncbi:MAG: hypothetical protein EOP82_17830 [Variovorax sp.]|nr:MAG: hypothetical protein EOP82_17830 [Variovorax sp.]